jgi:predicted phosphodiesterase
MKKILRISGIFVLLLAVYSMIPVIILYISPDPKPYTNREAVEKIKGKTGDYFEFVVLGDNHAGLILDDGATLKLVHNINRERRFKKAPIDFVCIVGDVTFRGSKWDYRAFNKIRARINKPVICAIGNHDNDKDNGELFAKYTGRDEFSFVDRNSYFIILNNEENDLTEKQFSRLEEDLKKSLAYTHRFVFLHKNPISYQQTWYRPEESSWAYRFMKLCEKYKVDIVFSGHEHMFRKGAYGGVKYITSGSGGIITHIPNHEGGFLHYVVVRVYGDYVDYEVRRVMPPFWEFLVYYMWKDIFYFLKGIVI